MGLQPTLFVDALDWKGAYSPLNPKKLMREKLSKDKKRSRIIRVRVNDEEYQAIEARKGEGLSMSFWLRALALFEDPKPKRRLSVPKCDPELVREVARIGSNLNQTVRALNRASLVGTPVDLVEVAAELASTEERLREFLKEHSR